MNKTERKIFWNTLCSLEGRDLSADREKLLATIKYPPLLYRYRPINLKSLGALQDNKLFYSAADYYDDPFDTYLRIDWHKVNDGITSINLKSPDAFSQFQEACKNFNIGMETTEKMRPQFESLTHKDLLNAVIDVLVKRIRPMIQKSTYSICFSENSCNENLWLKYADNHKGFCLIYNPYNDANFLCGKEEKCKNCLIAHSSNSLFPVYYSEEKYDASQYALSQAVFTFIVEELKNVVLAKKFVEFAPMHWEREKISLIKHKCHEYDEEWRMLLGATPTDLTCLRWIPYGVILGLRTEILEEKLIINAAKQAGIKHIYQTIISPLDELDAVELTNEQIARILNS